MSSSDDGWQKPDHQKEQKRNEIAQAILFILLGDAALLGFNLLINAIDIYQELTGNSNIGTVLSQSYNFPNSIMSLILCFWKPKNLKIILLIGLTAHTVLLCVLPIFILANNVAEKVVYWCTVIGCALLGAFGSWIFSSTFSLASQFGGKAMGFVSNGNGVCGIIAAVLRIATKAAVSSASGQRISSGAYFFIGAAIDLATLIYFIFALRRPDFAKAAVISNVEEIEGEKEIPNDGIENQEGQTEVDDTAHTSFCSKNTWEVIKVIYPFWIAEFLDFLITLTIFPGYMASTRQDRYGLGSWVPVIVTAVFCLFDWVGRSLPSKIIWPREKYGWVPIIFRLLFFPIFILSIEGVISVGEPIWTFVWDIPFALSNGYFGTICMIYGSNLSALSAPNKKFAAFLLSFAINGGILCAMFLATALPQH